MPSVRKDTARAEGGMRAMTRVASGEAATVGAAGNAVPTQQEAHVEQECAGRVLP